MLHLLDTSVLVSLIRGKVSQTELPARDQCVVSVISAAELEVGIHRSARPSEQRLAVAGLLECFKVLDWDVSAVVHYGEIRSDLEKKGTPIGPLDLLIAAHACSLGAAVVTGNVDEFRRVKGLKVVPWES